MSAIETASTANNKNNGIAEHVSDPRRSHSALLCHAARSHSRVCPSDWDMDVNFLQRGVIDA